MKKKKCFNCGYWNARDAAYCTLCYEPLNKPAGRAGPKKPAAAAPAVPVPVPLPPLVLKAALLGLLAAGAGIWIYQAARNTGGEPVLAAGRANRFEEKTAAADRLLDDYLAAKEALLAEIGSGPMDPDGFAITGEYTSKLFGIEEDYAAAMSVLKLPPLSAVSKTTDSLYLEWEESHRHRETAAMEDFSVKYQRLAEKAEKGGS